VTWAGSGNTAGPLGYTKATANGGDGVEFKIDLHAACQWVNPGAVAAGDLVVSYFPNYGAYLELTCIGAVL
jgi:hypothetical protein